MINSRILSVTTPLELRFVLITLLTLLASCGNTLNVDKIEETILSGITKQGANNVKSVICPDRVAPKVGGEFECIGVLDSGNGFAIAVTQQDDQGDVLWKVSSVKGLLNMASLQTEFEQALKKEIGQAKVDCGLNPYRMVKPGETFECQLMKRDSKKDASKESSESKKVDLSKTISTTQSTTDQSEKSKPILPQISDLIQVTIQPSGDVNWQRVVKVPEAKPASVASTHRTTEQATSSKQAPAKNQSSESKATPPAAKSAEDFLNQPGATDDFE